MTPSEKPLYLELTKHTLLAARVSGSAVELFRECALENKPAVEETLSAFDPDWKTNGFTAIATEAPLPISWHLSSSEEASRYRNEDVLREFAAKLPHGLTGELELTCCHAADGTAISTQGSAPWVLGVSTADALAAHRATAAAWKITTTRSESSTLSEIGGIVTALRFAGSGSVILWDLAVERSQLFLLTPRGIEAIAPCTAGLDAIFGAVQTAIGLKFRAAAARLFFNETYDFSEIGAQVAAPLAAALQAARATLPASGQNAAFTCTHLTGKQSWFIREAAVAAGLQPWSPNMRLLAAQLKLQFSDPAIESALTSSALGLLHLVASKAHQTTAWHPVWTRKGSTPLSGSVPPVAAPTSAPVAVAPPAPAPASAPPVAPALSPVVATVIPAAATITPAPVVPMPSPVVAAAVPVPVVVPPAAPKILSIPPAPPVPKAVAPAAKPAGAVPPAPAPAPSPKVVAAQKPAPAPTAAAKPASSPAKGPSSSSKGGKSASTPAASKTPATPKAAPTTVPAVPAVPAVPTKPVATPAAPSSSLVYPGLAASKSSEKNKKGGIGLYLGIAAAVIVAVAGFFWKSSQDAKAAKVAATEQAAQAEKLRVDAARQKAEADAKAKAEATRVQREAETAATQAREQTAREETDRQQRAQQQEAERIARSPGTLLLSTSPSSASVSIDGGPAQKSPLKLSDLPPGPHRARITLPGHDPVELPFEIKGTQTTDLGVVQLERAFGTVAIASQPEGLEFSFRPALSLLGAPPRTGRTPATFDDVEPGEHVVTVSRAPWKDQTQTVTLAKRATVRASVAFSDSVIRFTSTPAGATVRRDGTVLGTTPFTLQEPGGKKAAYVFGLPDHEELSLPAETVSGEILDLAGTLRRVDRLAQPGEVKQQPKAFEQPGPVLSAEQRRMVADIVIAVTIGRDGKLRDLVVEKASNKDIAQLCVNALGKWKFEPALGRDDQPISVRIRIPFRIGAN